MRNRLGQIGSLIEARAASCVRSAYAGSISRCTGATSIYGHIIVNATGSDTIALIDDSIDWRDRIVKISAFTPAAVASGIPSALPAYCASNNLNNNYYTLEQIWLSAAGYQIGTMVGGTNSICMMINLNDRTTTANVIFYADNITGNLNVIVKAGQNRGITFWFDASEPLGYQTAIT